jgi:hypothetical protein
MTARHLTLRWSQRDGRDVLLVGGWSRAELEVLGQLSAPDLARRLSVLPTHLVTSAAELHGFQAAAGRFEIDGDEVCFTPRFPFSAGVSYSLLVAGAAGTGAAGVESWAIERPQHSGTPTTTVLGIYPSAAEVPVNLLKIYIYFSAPMSEGHAARAAQVRRADDGELLEGVFLPAGPELWDHARQRLTLLLDPGRIKRGLAPHEQAGYPLVEGVPIVIAVDPSFLDAQGLPLRASAQRSYQVGPPIRTRIAPADWMVSHPAAGSDHPLTAQFDRPLDRALLEHGLSVQDDAGRQVPGTARIGPGEQSWVFTPQSPWGTGRYVVAIEQLLEDLAGNRLDRVFDRELTESDN